MRTLQFPDDIEAIATKLYWMREWVVRFRRHDATTENGIAVTNRMLAVLDEALALDCDDPDIEAWNDMFRRIGDTLTWGILCDCRWPEDLPFHSVYTETQAWRKSLATPA